MGPTAPRHYIDLCWVQIIDPMQLHEKFIVYAWKYIMLNILQKIIYIFNMKID